MAAAKAFVAGGVGAQPSLEDVVRVALGCQIVLDTAGAERIKKESPPPKSFQAEPASSAADAPGKAAMAALPALQARAAVACRLLSIMNGKSGVRLQVAEFLRNLLNANIVPALPAEAADAEVLQALAEACKGLGSCSAATQEAAAASQPLGDTLAAAAVDAPGVSAAERVVMQGGASVSAGIGSLVVVGGRRLLNGATAVAALSCEAFGAQVKAFDADAVEAQSYKAAISAADELRGLLEGSKLVNTRRDASPETAQLFAALPQRLGAVQESLTSAYNAVRPEVQSGALAPKGTVSPNAPSPLLASTLLDAARAMLALATDSLSRASAVAAASFPSSTSAGAALQLQQLVASPSSVVQQRLALARRQLLSVGQHMLGDVCSVPGVAAAQAAVAALDAAHGAVALEALVAVAALRVREGPAAPLQPTGPAALSPTPEDNGANKENTAGKKDKKKDKKGGGGAAAFALGKGTAVARAALEAAAAESAGFSGSSSLPLAPAGGASAAADGPATAPGVPAASASSSLAEGALGADGGESGPAALGGLQGALEPLGAALPKLLKDVRLVVEANQASRKPKIPKGARDFLPDQMAIREAAFAAITGVFKRHGAVAIDTPVFELRETLMGKYGEDSKLIYDLADQGGELLSLRYDLTVPFARYVAVNNVGNIKRYHIGKVYRRDQPQMNRGRFREFFQCDFDIAGSYSAMVADAEVLKVVTEILTDLKLGKFTIKLNHRGILDAMLAIAGVPAQKFRPICSAIDKLDKEPWSEVRREMVEDKGLPPAVADRIGEFVVLRGEPLALLAQLTAGEHPLWLHPQSKAALEDMRLLFGFLQSMGALGNICFDLSLARGLDYYTGVIYEAVLEGAAVGSIAAGGRYDRLVGMFSSKDVPAVGVSIGIERVFVIMEAQARERAAASGVPIRATETEVLVASIGNNMQNQRMELAAKLWESGIKAEFGFKPNPKMGDQLTAALEQGIPFMVLFGEDELQRGVVKVKDMAAKEETSVALEELVPTLRSLIAAKQAAGSSLTAPTMSQQPEQQQQQTA